MNNTKKSLQHSCAIVNICLSGLLALLLLIIVLTFDFYFDVVSENMQISADQLELVKTSTMTILVMVLLLSLVTLAFSIVSEVFTVKQKNSKGFFITLIVMDAIFTSFSLSTIYLLAFAIPLGLAIAVVCMKDTQIITE